MTGSSAVDHGSLLVAVLYEVPAAAAAAAAGKRTRCTNPRQSRRQDGRGGQCCLHRPRETFAYDGEAGDGEATSSLYYYCCYCYLPAAPPHRKVAGPLEDFHCDSADVTVAVRSAVRHSAHRPGAAASALADEWHRRRKIAAEPEVMMLALATRSV